MFSLLCTYCRFLKNMLLAALWFLCEKPPMSTFLRHLMEAMNDLYIQGEQNFVFSV